MSKKKGGLLSEIAAKVKRKKELKEEIADRRNNLEAFAMKMINDMEDMIATTANTSLLATLAPLYAKGFEERVKVIDSGCKVDVQWFTDADGALRVSGILITWSKHYQAKNNVDEQLFVDVTSLLLK
jgi:hypothetical protein